MDEAIRQKILALLDQHRIMTIATLRPDGWPQATTVGYVNEGLTLYFLCGLESQKAKNLARDDRVSLTIDHDTPDIMAITGLSMAARATAVLDYSKGFGHTDLVTAEGPMGVTIRSGAVYFAIVFLVGFALGALRTLVMAPRPSDTLAVLLEAPVILTVGWFVATWCIGRFKVPAATLERLAMGGVALALLMVAELDVSLIFFH